VFGQTVDSISGSGTMRSCRAMALPDLCAGDAGGMFGSLGVHAVNEKGTGAWRRRG
jgi:hypothetical protein